MVAAQLGEAMILSSFLIAWELISGMMRGTLDRNAELESTMRQVVLGIHSFEIEEPAQKKARSILEREFSSNISIGRSDVL